MNQPLASATGEGSEHAVVRSTGDRAPNREWEAFRKRPIVIQAVQWFEKEHLARQNFKPGHGISGSPDPLTSVYYRFHNNPDDPPTPMIGTLEGEHIVSDGDWIIIGVKGERYPCKPDIFAATYEPIHERATCESLADSPHSTQKGKL